MKTTNIDKMTKFLADVQAAYEKAGWPYVFPKVTQGLDENDEPDDRHIDAHWKKKEFELLLSLDDGGFAFYGDNYGEVNVTHGEPNPQDVATALRKLQTAKASA